MNSQSQNQVKDNASISSKSVFAVSATTNTNTSTGNNGNGIRNRRNSIAKNSPPYRMQVQQRNNVFQPPMYGQRSNHLPPPPLPPPGMTPEMMKQFAAHHQSQMAFAAAMYRPGPSGMSHAGSSTGRYNYNPMISASAAGAVSRLPQGMGGNNTHQSSSSPANTANYNGVVHGSGQHRDMGHPSFPSMPPRHPHQQLMGQATPTNSPFGHFPPPIPPAGVFDQRNVGGMLQIMQNHNAHAASKHNYKQGRSTKNLSHAYRSPPRNKGSSGRKPTSWKHLFMEPNSPCTISGSNSPSRVRGQKPVPVTNPYGFHYSSIKDGGTNSSTRVSNDTRAKIVGVTEEQISRAIPKDASAIFHVLDRRINFDAFPEDASLYSLLRAWVQDDPYRYIPPPDLASQIERNCQEALSEADKIWYPRRIRRKVGTSFPKCDILTYILKKPYIPSIGSIDQLKYEAIQRGKSSLMEAKKERSIRMKVAREKLRKRGFNIE